jgi:hypothetical protein
LVFGVLDGLPLLLLLLPLRPWPAVVEVVAGVVEVVVAGVGGGGSSTKTSSSSSSSSGL